MKIKKFLKCVLISLILIAFCLSIAAFAKANSASKTAERAQETANSDTEEIEKNIKFIAESLEKECGKVEIVPYSQNGERRYLVFCEQYFVAVYSCKVEDGELVILFKTRMKRG